MNIHQVSRINISPEVIDCIVFWTKNPLRFVDRLSKLSNYHYYFQYTITGYGQKLEPNVPSLDSSLSCFKSLSNLIGENRVIWRYDPIIITDEQSITYHVAHFAHIAERLAGFTRKCVISFVDYYTKTKKNMAHIKYRNITNDQIVDLSQHLHRIAEKHNILLASCAEELDLKHYGIPHGRCIDDKLIEEISGFAINVSKDKGQRSDCGCVASVDIGAYNTCQHGCVYCYANYDLKRVRCNYLEHNSKSDLLFGKVLHQDKISDRRVVSCKELRKSLF